MTAPVVLAAHGSRDPRSARTMNDLAAAAGRRRAGPVRAAFLDFNRPSIPAALKAATVGGGSAPTVAGAGSAPAPIVVPALLTSAYHGRVDLPEVLRSTGLPARVTPVLGPAEPGHEPHPRLIAALIRRLSELTGPGVGSARRSEVDGTFDGLVLIAAGTSHAAARSTVEKVAAALGERLHVPCRVGYASASAPTAAEAVAQLRRAGASQIVAASYFLAAGRLYDAAAASAHSAGVVGVAEPIGAAQELVELVLERVSAVT